MSILTSATVLDQFTPDFYEDEAPEGLLEDGFDPADDLAYWLDKLGLMRLQRPDCLNLPATLAALDAKINEAVAVVEALGGRAYEPTETDWLEYNEWSVREEALDALDRRERQEARDATYETGGAW